jgi:hypothetical protein
MPATIVSTDAAIKILVMGVTSEKANFAVGVRD